jgi:hypothetical protein
VADAKTMGRILKPHTKRLFAVVLKSALLLDKQYPNIGFL